MTMTAGARLGPYEIVGALGAGGMGEVYKARDTRLDRVVAIKILPERFATDPGARARFEREARAISHLNDPHICTLYDIGRETPSSPGGRKEAEGTAAAVDFLVMEYLEGRTLAERLEKRPLPLADVLRYGRDIAHALDRAHRAGIVHRDLKPANIMLAGGGTRQAPAQVKLMDFGLARGFDAERAGRAALTEVATIARPVTAEGTIVGTLNYMAPEQLEAGETDARTDVWALGCVLYEMASGKRPFEGASQASLVAAIMEREPEPLARLQPLSPPALEHVVARCLAKDPAERWQSARDVAHELEWIAQSAVIPAVQVSIRSRHRLRWLVAAAVIALLATASGSLVFLAGRAAAPAPPPPKFTRLTFQRGLVISGARFMPDGKSVALGLAVEAGPTAIYEARLGTVGPPRLLDLGGRSLHAVSASGRLLLARTAEWRAVGLWSPLEQASLSSGPRPIAEDVSWADWQGDEVIAIRREGRGDGDRLEWPLGTVKLRTSGAFSHVRLAPDGRSLALIEHPVVGDGRGVVVLYSNDRKTVISEDLENAMGLAWSPDGQEVWFSGTYAGPKQALYAVTVDGTRRRKLSEAPTSMVLHDVAADGRALVSSFEMEVGTRGVLPGDATERNLNWLDYTLAKAMSDDGWSLLMDEQGDGGGPGYTTYLRHQGPAAPMELGNGSGLALSADGRYALLQTLTAPQRLTLVDTKSWKRTELPAGPVETFQSAAFVGNDRIVFSGSARGRPSARIWLQELSGQNTPRELTGEGAVRASALAPLCVSSDERRLAAVDNDSRLLLISLDDASIKVMNRLEPLEVVCRWGTGDRTLYTYKPGKRAQVFEVSVSSGDKRPVRSIVLQDGGLWNLVLSRDGRSYAYSYTRTVEDLYLMDGALPRPRSLWEWSADLIRRPGREVR